MKKIFISAVLSLVLTLSLCVSAHAEIVASATAQEARLALVFQSVADMWDTDTSVSDIKTLHDFAGNEYTLAEFSPSGYAIYHNSSAVILEKAENSPSPYKDLSENLYYAGPTHYYMYDEAQDIYTHTVSGETLSTADAAVRAEVCAQAQPELNSMADVAMKAYIESGVMSAQNYTTLSSNSYTYVGGHGAFFENLKTREQIGYYSSGEGGNCGYVAAGLVLLYYDYYGTADFIDNSEYLSSSGNAFRGEAFVKYLYERIGKLSGYSNSLNARQAAIVMRNYLIDRGIAISYWEGSMPSKSEIVLQLKQGRPVIYADRWDDPSSAGKTVDHLIVVYGYNSNNKLVAHFGWSNYSHVECTSSAFALFISTACAIESYSNII